MRRSPNADDGRSHHIELTSAGKAVHAEIMPLAIDMERRLFAQLTASEINEFKALLARITARVAELEAGTKE